MPDRKKVILAIKVLDDFFGDDNKIHAVLPSDAWGIIRELLKEQEPKPIINKWHKNPLGDYSRLHCPWCDRELDMQSAKEYVACPYCGRPVKWE